MQRTLAASVLSAPICSQESACRLNVILSPTVHVKIKASDVKKKKPLCCFGVLTAAGTTMIVLSTGDKSIVIRMLKGQLAAEIQDGNKAHGQTVQDIT